VIPRCKLEANVMMEFQEIEGKRAVEHDADGSEYGSVCRHL
jgi:hypothetical protein